MLTTLIYRSQINLTYDGFSLSKLVSNASNNNIKEGITGILLFNGYQFFQVLEGSEKNIDKLYLKITTDSRHFDVVELMRDYSSYRRFSDIGMYMLDTRQDEIISIINKLLQISQYNEFLPHNDRIFRLINAFLTNNKRHILPAELTASRWNMKLLYPMLNCPEPIISPEQPCQFAFQAIIQTEESIVSSFEALIRCPTGKSPEKIFSTLPKDERYKFDLDSKIYAFLLAKKLGIKNQKIAINLMPGSLLSHPTAVEHLKNSVQQAGLHPEQIIIEVTENEVISCLENFQKILKNIRVEGFSLAIDDFGSGYSGLSLLTRFQPEIIKIDADLVGNIHKNGAKQAIVASVVQCCEDLGITVIAEGVETINEWCWLQSVGIRFFQGFLFSKPFPGGIGEIYIPVLIK